MTGSGITSISQWYVSNGTAVNFGLTTSANTGGVGAGKWANGLTGSQVTAYTFYPDGTQQSITTGQVFNYVINFANGQSVSGSLIAQ